MNTPQIIDEVAKLTGKTKVQTLETVAAVFNVLKVALHTGKDVRISGFGAFRVKPTKARVGRNPHTGEAVGIPARQKVTFKAAKELKEGL